MAFIQVEEHEVRGTNHARRGSTSADRRLLRPQHPFTDDLARLSRAFSDPGADELPDQQLAGRSAGDGRHEPAQLLEAWANRGVRAWEDSWWSLASDLGDLVAPLIGARKGEVVFQPNVTLTHAVVFSACFVQWPRNKIVTDAMHFPSILYLIDEQRKNSAEVVVVPIARWHHRRAPSDFSTRSTSEPRL